MKEVLTIPAVAGGYPTTTGGIIRDESLPAERIVETLVPMKWPEYLHVTDLPFSELLYATLR